MANMRFDSRDSQRNEAPVQSRSVFIGICSHCKDSESCNCATEEVLSPRRY